MICLIFLMSIVQPDLVRESFNIIFVIYNAQHYVMFTSVLFLQSIYQTSNWFYFPCKQIYVSNNQFFIRGYSFGTFIFKLHICD